MLVDTKLFTTFLIYYFKWKIGFKFYSYKYFSTDVAIELKFTVSVAPSVSETDV